MTQTIIERGALNGAAKALKDAGLCGAPLIVCDSVIEGLYLEEVKARFPGAAVCVLPAGGHADEYAVGLVLMMSGGADYLVALGSGTVCDTVRYVASRSGLGFAILATAPSMDGFASSVSPLIIGGFKTTFSAKPPAVIVGDVDILAQAPAAMIAAGLGDVLGKNTALMDWRIAAAAIGEPLDESVFGFMNDALLRCEEGAAGLPGRAPASIKLLMECLVQSGEAIRRWGSSRPASGTEHHISHFWEMRSIARYEPASLHGDKVGAATLLAIEMYRRFFAGGPPPLKPYNRNGWEGSMRRVFGAAADGVIRETGGAVWEQGTVADAVTAQWDTLKAAVQPLLDKEGAIRGALRAAGGPVTPAEIGICRDDVRDALLHAMDLRHRFTIQRLLSVWGVLPDIADAMMEGMS